VVEDVLALGVAEVRPRAVPSKGTPGVGRQNSAPVAPPFGPIQGAADGLEACCVRAAPLVAGGAAPTPPPSLPQAGPVVTGDLPDHPEGERHGRAVNRLDQSRRHCQFALLTHYSVDSPGDLRGVRGIAPGSEVTGLCDAVQQLP